MEFEWRLKRNDNININNEKYPIDKPSREIYNFTLYDKLYYHEKAQSESTVINLKDSDILKKVVLHLPTIEYSEYNHMSNNLETPKDYCLLRDGRPNSPCIKNYYSPHIMAREVESETLYPVINNIISYYKNNNIKNIFTVDD